MNTAVKINYSFKNDTQSIRPFVENFKGPTRLQVSRTKHAVEW